MIDSPHNRKPAIPRWYAAVAPGVLVAATGVGAGDLLTASLAGAALGLTLLWAAWVGAVLKYQLNEGIARWQMATGTTLLEGWATRLGPWIEWPFFVYFLFWSFFTAGAMVNACGVAGMGLLPIFPDAQTGKIVWGVFHSLAGLTLVLVGGFPLFERLMGVFIGLMFLAVVVTAACMLPETGEILRGLFIPRPPLTAKGLLDRVQLSWLLGVLGGVGGTVTLLSYGYWIREEGRAGQAGLRACRLDLKVGYVMTGLFGVCMIMIGSRLELNRGAWLALDLADGIGAAAGPAGPVLRWVFLVGFWGAVFSSLLGVWQSVPYFFADFMLLWRRVPAEQGRQIVLRRTTAYRGYLIALATIPLSLLWLSVKQAQLTYAVLGAFFMPLLALTLLIMNNRTSWVGREFRSGWLSNAVLALTLLLFGYVGAMQIVEAVGK